jgi:hypothetical protein
VSEGFFALGSSFSELYIVDKLLRVEKKWHTGAVDKLPPSVSGVRLRTTTTTYPCDVVVVFGTLGPATT